MSITILKTLDEYSSKHPAPHVCIYGQPGVGKSETWLSVCRPPLSWRCFFINTEEKALPEGLAAEVYNAGGVVVQSTALSDIDRICREVEKGGYDVVVYDGFTVGHRNSLVDKVDESRDPRKVYFAVQMQTYNGVRALRATGRPLLSTALEAWKPTRIKRDNRGDVITETVVPESERLYTVDLPNRLQGGFPALCEAMGRMVWLAPGDMEIKDRRYVRFTPTGKEDVKSEYRAHKPGVTIPYGSNGAFLLLYPWLRDVGRLTEEMQQYYNKTQKEIKLGN